MSALEERIARLGTVCAGLADRREGPLRDSAYTMAGIGLSAFSLFFIGGPCFLAHQRALAEGQGGSNCQTLSGISAIPTDNDIRLMLDGAPTAAFDGLFIKAIETPVRSRIASATRRNAGCPGVQSAQPQPGDRSAVISMVTMAGTEARAPGGCWRG